MIINSLVCAFLILAVLFFLGTVVGLIRFPDFYTRMHAASKGDTLSTMLVVCAFALYNLHDPSMDNVIVSVKLLFIVGFVFISSPTASHALTRTAFVSGVRPWTVDETVDEAEALEEKKND